MVKPPTPLLASWSASGAGGMCPKLERLALMLA